MLGPVVGMELLRAGRRGRAHVLVWLFAGWLVLQLLYLYGQYDTPDRPRITPSATADFARSFIDLVLGQQFILVVLVTPAFAAGAITDEKTRGTLESLLTADLTPAAIVLGKLVGRATQVIVLGLTPLPLLALIGPYAGVTPEFLIIGLAETALLVVGLSAMAILASVWTKQTRNAVLLTYIVLGGLWWLFAAGPTVVAQYIPPECGQALDPLRPLHPALDRTDPAEAFRRLRTFAVAWGGVAVACSAVAVWRLRPVYLRQLVARPRRWIGLAALVPRPAPTDDVLAWKERYVGRRVPLWVGLPVVATVSVWAMSESLGGWHYVSPRRVAGPALVTLGWWVLLLMTLVVGVRASGAITGERERQAWEGLLTTPLTPRQIVRGKLKGILLSVWPYLLTVGIVTLAVVGIQSALAGLAALFVIPLTLAVIWLSMYFVGAVGLFCSARSPSSWRSLLMTIALGYVGGFTLLCVSAPMACVVSMALSVIAGILDALMMDSRSTTSSFFFGPSGPWNVLFPLAGAVGVALTYWWAARSLLDAAERHIILHDRVAGRAIDIPFTLWAGRLRR
jgi:ABC-type transport system involved in multi-copper enzyme maturation permease subunit